MNEVISGIKITLGSKRAWIYGGVGGFFGMLIASLSVNYQTVFALFDTPLSLPEQTLLSLQTLVYWYGLMAPLQQLLALCMAILFSLSIALTYVYMKTKGMRNLSTGLASGLFGFVSATIGLHCIACGAVLLSFLFSLLGISSSFLGIGTSISFVIGIFMLCISIYITAKKISSPLVCDM